MNAMRYVVRFNTHIDVSVTIESTSAEEAADEAWPLAQEYLETIWGDSRDIVAEATLDGIGAYEVEAKP